MKLQFRLAGMVACAISCFAACTGVEPAPEQPGTPETPETPEQGGSSISREYANADLVYYGSDGEGLATWTLVLYTDMELVSNEAPLEAEGPGQALNLMFYTKEDSAAPEDFASIAGAYEKGAMMSVGTYEPGYLGMDDTPSGMEMVPVATYFADFDENGEYEFELLADGSFSIEIPEDGGIAVNGVLSGSSGEKREFSYTGTPDVFDLTTVPQGSDNSTLTDDIVIPAFSKAVLIDREDSYTYDERARALVLYLAEDGIDLSGEWPKGSGKVMRIEIFTDWDTDVREGIPAGTYTATDMVGGGGIPGEQIKAFGLVPGYPDRFQYFSGTWYIEMADDVWTDYARIQAGTVTVGRDGDAHELDVRLEDCAVPSPHAVGGVWKTDGPISVLNL